jgi:hypothetical protein
MTDLEKFLELVNTNPTAWEPYINRDVLLRRIADARIS